MSIENFKGSFADLARPNRFKVILGRLGPNMEFHCKGAAAPGQTVDRMDTFYQGRTLPLPGDRTYQDWVVTVYGAIDYDIYNRLKQWSEQINAPESNVSAPPEAIMEDATVIQLDRANNPAFRWELAGCWPTEVGQIDFDWGSNSTPLEFQATFAFMYIKE